jgi:hypothetical protein
MKNALFLSLALLATACEVVVVEPRYDERERVTGSYQVDEYSETYNSSFHYRLQISKSGSSNDIYLDNFYDADLLVRGELVGNKIVIPWQLRDGYEIEGVGTVYGNSITFSYTVKDTYNDIPTDFCETEAWRD